jgi:hypothetical protein
MTSMTTRGLLAAATFLGGIVAGFSLNRELVDISAWNALGAVDWVRFTRHADLGPGLVVYPAEGLAALAATVGAAVAFHFDRTAPRSAAVPVHLAVVTAVVAFAITRFALAPDTLRMRDANVAPTDLTRALEHMRAWWGPKATLHVVTFACNIWSFSVSSR